jgi:hypothetical protein
VKHLFDVGQLALLAENVHETIETYRKVHAEQCKWRGDHELPACLADTQAAAALVSQVSQLNKADGNTRLEFFRKGINSVSAHMFSERFGRTEARIAAGRAALVAAIIGTGSGDFPLKAFLESAPVLDEMKAAKLQGEWAPLDRLKRTDIRAYVCWVEMQKLTGGEGRTPPLASR